jgi:hypothetical protein
MSFSLTHTFLPSLPFSLSPSLFPYSSISILTALFLLYSLIFIFIGTCLSELEFSSAMGTEEDASRILAACLLAVDSQAQARGEEKESTSTKEVGNDLVQDDVARQEESGGIFGWTGLQLFSLSAAASPVPVVPPSPGLSSPVDSYTDM